MMKTANDILLKALGTLLIIAGTLKGWQLLTEPAANNSIWTWRPFMVLQVDKDWFVTTPAVALLTDGRVTSAWKAKEPLKEKELDSAAMLYSLHASGYLANIKALARFSIMYGKHIFWARDEAGILSLLQSEVNTANDLTKKTIKWFGTAQSQLCGEHQGLVDEVIEGISAMISIEKEILEYEPESSDSNSVSDQSEL